MAYIIKSIRGQDLIVDDFFLFRKVRTNENSINWRCTNVRCTSTANTLINYETNIEYFVICQPHNHLPNRLEAIRKIKYNEIIQMLYQNHEFLREILNYIIRGGSIEIIEAIGDFDSVYRTIRNLKNKLKNLPPFIFPTLKLSRNLSYTHTNELFFRYGPDNYNNSMIHDEIIIFFSNTMFNHLNSSRIWSMNGTFQAVPKPFYQLFTISYLKNNHVFPCIFVLLKNIKKETNIKLLNLLINDFMLNSPLVIKSDFEKGLIIH